MRIRDIGRLIFALIFLMGAIVNLYIGLVSPGAYETFADDALLPLYRNFWNSLFYPWIRLFLAAVVFFELALTWLLLQSGIYVKVGLGLALVFTLFLVPFWWQGGAIANLVLASALLWLLRYEYPRSISEMLKEKLSSNQTGTAADA